MANERVILCGGLGATGSRGGGTPLRLRLWGPRRNIELQIDPVAGALSVTLPPAMRDLVDIATYVYVADQATTRGGAGVDNLGSDWRRKLHFRIPVRVPELWGRDSVQSSLTTTLGFLSEDEYTFEFAPLSGAPASQDSLFGGDQSPTEALEEVVLFSGGLDSLAGAIQEAVVDGRRIALVTHQPSAKLVKRYEKLREGLVAKAARAPLFLPVTVNKDEELGKEYTQRSRSFLYMALGGTVAAGLGLSRLRFYENGVISFNLPPSAQIVGAKATRTTHPRVLRGFSEILTLVTGRPFQVENPFLWHTKTDVVRAITAAGCADMIKFSTSCTHTWEMTRIHPHCGSCSQCIDRRFAVLAADAEAADPEDGYNVKLLTGPQEDETDRTMLAAYVETANVMSRMGEVDFFSRFGEATRVLRHVQGTATEVGRRVYELHRRHAQDVSGVVDRAIATYAREIRERTLPPTCLVRLVCDSATAQATSAQARTQVTAATPPPAPLAARNYFLRKGRNAWAVRFDGGTDFVLVRSKGAAYLHLLLLSPRESISAAKLAATVACKPEEYMLGGADEDVDEDAMTACRARYDELKDAMEEAKAQGNVSRQEETQREMGRLLEHMKAGGGLGSRRRSESGVRQRVRKAVGNAIGRAIKDIAMYDPRLAEHLKRPTIKRGFNPCYSPPQPVDWQLS